MGETVVFPAAHPRHGEVFVDPRDAGRALRVTWHPETQTVVLSVWRGDKCVATHRLPAEDVGRLVHALVDTVTTPPAARAAADDAET